MSNSSSSSGIRLRYWLLGWLLGATLIIAFLLWLVPEATWLLALKDVSIGLFLLISAPGWVPVLRRIPWWAGVIVLLILVYLAMSPAPLMAGGSAARQLLMPFVLLVTGMAMVSNTSDAEKLKTWLLRAAWVVIALGFLFYLVPFWKFFSLLPYTHAKNINYDKQLEIPAMFIEPLRGGIPRMVSTLLDPINLGHMLVFVLATGFYEKRHKYWQSAIVLAALLLTFCKGAFLQLFLLVLLQAPMPRWMRYAGAVAAVAALVVISRYHEGVLLHLEGLTASFKTMTLFGHGLGMTGNQATMYGHPLRLGIGDTYIGAVIGQLGLIGFLLWLLPFLWLLLLLKRAILLRNLLISQLLIAVLSENAFNLMSILFLMVTIGAFLKPQLLNEHSDH